MKIASNTLLGVSVAAGALIAAAGLTAQAHDGGAHVQAAPPYSTPEPSPGPPSPSPAPAIQQVPSDDYWTGQAGGGGAPGAGGAGGAGGGGGGGGGG